MTTFASMIKSRRDEKNWSLWDLALESGVSHQVISNMEHGKGCTMRKAFAVAKVLGINAIPVE